MFTSEKVKDNSNITNFFKAGLPKEIKMFPPINPPSIVTKSFKPVVPKPLILQMDLQMSTMQYRINIIP